MSQFRVCILRRTWPLRSLKASPSETLLTSSSFWSISWLRHQMFYPYVTISAAQVRESDDLHHTMSPFSLLLSSFSGMQRILGYVRPRRTVAVHPLKRGKIRSICGLHLEEPSNAPPKDADPELRHSNKVLRFITRKTAFNNLKISCVTLSLHRSPLSALMSVLVLLTTVGSEAFAKSSANSSSFSQLFPQRISLAPPL